MRKASENSERHILSTPNYTVIVSGEFKTGSQEASLVVTAILFTAAGAGLIPVGELRSGMPQGPARIKNNSKFFRVYKTASQMGEFPPDWLELGDVCVGSQHLHHADS